MRTTKRIAIYGLVQGVYFRGSMSQRATDVGLTGWVRNRKQGWVEAVIQGDAESVATLINWSKRGPDAARVTRVEVFDEDGEDYADFRQLPSL